MKWYYIKNKQQAPSFKWKLSLVVLILQGLYFFWGCINTCPESVRCKLFGFKRERPQTIASLCQLHFQCTICGRRCIIIWGWWTSACVIWQSSIHIGTLKFWTILFIGVPTQYMSLLRPSNSCVPHIRTHTLPVTAARSRLNMWNKRRR